MKTVNARYEVSHPDYGVIEHVPSLGEALTVAKNYCKNNSVEWVEVFDRMAHKGAVELWRLYVGSGKVPPSWSPVNWNFATSEAA